MSTDEILTPYGFSGRLRTEFPSQIVIDVTERCNLACIHCGHEEYSQGPLYTGKHMSDDIHDKIIQEVSTVSGDILQYIRYAAAGEPLLHPNIFDFLYSAKKKSGKRISLTTNGTLLTDQAIDSLLQTNIDIIDISIDAFSEKSYKEIRRKGNYQKVVKSVQKLLKQRSLLKSSLRVVVTFIEQEKNLGESKNFKLFWENAGVDYVIIRRLHSSGGYISEQAERMHDILKNYARRPCLYPWERLCVSPKGDIGFCPVSWSHTNHFTNLETSTLAEAWQGKFMQRLRVAHLDNDYKHFPLCSSCPDWSATRWPHEGRSFADMVKELCI